MDIYGKVVNFTGDKNFINWRYQGQYEDAETGLYYNRFRYYDAEDGRYISKDPIGLNSGEPNFYAYASNPNFWIDELGLYLRRPYIRKSTRLAIEQKAIDAGKVKNGRFIDANTTTEIQGGKMRKYSKAEGIYDMGHVKGKEFWREKQKAEAEGLTQKQFNERMNNPDLYQIEDPKENRSHKHEKKKNSYKK